MSDVSLSYYAPIPGIYGTANPATDSNPFARAALQEAYQAQNRALIENLVQTPGGGGYVPPGMGYGASAPEWATQIGGPSNLPMIGWTAQNAQGPVFGPYSSSNIGTVPDWTSDPNPAAAGSYDMNVTVTPEATCPINQGPIGAPFFDAPGADLPNNPNTSSQYSQGHIGQDLEW